MTGKTSEHIDSRAFTPPPRRRIDWTTYNDYRDALPAESWQALFGKVFAARPTKESWEIVAVADDDDALLPMLSELGIPLGDVILDSMPADEDPIFGVQWS